MRESGLFIHGGTVITMNGSYEVFESGYVVTEGDTITDVGSMSSLNRSSFSSKAEEAQKKTQAKDALGEAILKSERLDREIIDATGMVVIPGLVNAHTHLFQTFMRGLADDLPLGEWLRKAVWPLSCAMTEEDFYLAALIGCMENLKCGATSVIDNHYVHTNPRNDDRVFQAMKDTGIRGIVARGLADQGYKQELSETPDIIFRELDRLMEEYHGTCNGRLGLSVGPVNPWGCSQKLLTDAYAYAKRHDLGFHIHTAETRHVRQTTIDRTGKPNVLFLQGIGAFGEHSQLVHSVWIDEEEMGAIRESGACVIHCPVANMYLASGVAPVPSLRRLGTQVCLATDGPGSNNSQDMLETLKFTACLHKVHNLDASVMLPGDVLRMATSSGATAMRNPDIGSLGKGKKADIVLVDLRKSHIAPVHSALSAVVYNANGNDVHTVIVDGRPVVKAGRILAVDEGEIIEQANRRLKALMGE